LSPAIERYEREAPNLAACEPSWFVNSDSEQGFDRRDAGISIPCNLLSEVQEQGVPRTFLPLVICEVQLADFSEQKAHTYDKWIYQHLRAPRPSATALVRIADYASK
jgi:hypothetical protein